jgi:hypothetical protein
LKNYFLILILSKSFGITGTFRSSPLDTRIKL